MPEELSRIYSDAVSAHKRGDLEAAERGYRTVAQRSPSHTEVQYLLGAVLMQGGNAEAAVSPLRKCLNAQPNHIGALNTLGAALSVTGQSKQAIEVLRRAVELSPEDQKTLINLGKACTDAGQFDLGEQSFKRILALTPHHPIATHGLAVCVLELGRNEETISILEAALAAGVEDPKLSETLIQQLLYIGDLERALEHVESAYQRWPDNNALLLAYATTLRLLERHDDALRSYETLVSREPENPAFLNSFGGYLYDVGRWKDAESYVIRALKIEPESHSALTNMGRIRQQRGDLDGAKAFYLKALDVAPSYADAHNNLGNLLMYMDDADQALSHFDKAVELKPQSNGIRYNRSTTRMTTGAISAGVQDHRLRFDKENPAIGREWPWPLWQGESLDSKRILLWGEQGIGDQVIHARSAPIAAARARSCVLECSDRLTTLFQRSFPDVEVVGAKDPPPGTLIHRTFDFQSSTLDFNCSLYDSPNDISSEPYLKADSDLVQFVREKYRPGSDTRPLVGISWWSGFTTQAHFKSTPLTQWQPILSNADARFVSLQYGNGRDEIAPFKASTGIDLVDDREIDPMGDLDLFAAQIAAMDLVITISNTTAHMAGALGVPTWTLTPTGPGRVWYWFTEGQKSPWYESMQLFRHTYNEGWDRILSDVSERLSKELPHLSAKG